MEQKFVILSEAMRYASCDVVHSVRRSIPGHISGRNESLPQSQGDLYESRSLALTVISTEKCAGSARHHHQRWKMLLRRAVTWKKTQLVYANLVLKYEGTVNPVMNE